MRASALILVLSLLANAALLTALAAGHRAHRTEGAGQQSTSAATVQAANGQSEPADTLWTDLQSSDLTAARDRLRAEGFPPSIIRTILKAKLAAQYEPERKAIEGPPREQAFWLRPMYNPDTAAALAALAAKQRRLLTELLGPDPNDYVAQSIRHKIAGLSPEKAAQLGDINDRYSFRQMEIWARRHGENPGEQQRQLAELEKAKHAEFAQILSPQELEAFDFRSGNTAGRLRARIGSIETNEEEFRALYKLQAAYDEATGEPIASEADSRARSIVNEKFEGEIAAVLGPDRWQAMQRSGDYFYQQTSRLVTRLGLPAQTANDLYAMQREFQDRQASIVRQTPDRAAAAEQLKALETEATARALHALGGSTKALEAYKTYGGGWLAIAPPPKS